MKKSRKSLFAAVIAAVVLMTGFSATTQAADINSAEAEPKTTQIVIDGILNGLGEEQTTRALEEGEEWAIHLIDPESEDGNLAGGYKFIELNEASQGKLYMSDASKIVITAQNHKEDLQSLDVWADNACAMIKIKNITYACETNFSEPKKTKICGYDAIMYDCEILQYIFDEDKTTRELYDTYRGRNYYFYSDKNAYVIMFDTNDETWTEEVNNFEKFVSSLVVDGKKNSSGIPPVARLIILGSIIAIVIAGMIAGPAILKKKKKAE